MKRLQLALMMVCLLAIQQISTAQQAPIQKEKFHFGGVEQDSASGYAQAIKVDNVIYISGTVALDITPAGIKNLYTTLQKTLAHYGAGFQHVVKENLYTTDIEAMKSHNEIRKVFYKNDFPAATWIQISRLFMPYAKLEIELIAHLPK